MNLQKILFFSIIILILINIIVLNANKIQETGTINTIKYSNNKITITLHKHQIPYILFTDRLLDIKKGDTIHITGQKSTYKNKPQIIINKITKTIPQPI